jgi:hypothetical protein
MDMLYKAVYIAVIYAASMIPIIRWRILDLPERIITLLLVLAAAQQTLSLFGGLSNSDVARLYNTFVLVEFLLVSLYFNYSRPAFRRRHLGIVFGILGVLLGILNICFLQRFDVVATYFSLFEAAAIVLYCLVAFMQMPLAEDYQPTRSKDFWIAVLQLCSVSPTLIGWLLISITGDDYGSPFQKIFFQVIIALSLLFYIGMAIFFLRYHKLRRFPENGVRANRLEQDNY